MTFFSKYVKGDKPLWAIVTLIVVVSFLPVYSTSSNLVYTTARGGDTFLYLLRHLFLTATGLLIAFVIHIIPYRKFKGLAKLGLLLSVIFLITALIRGTQIEGANASRWINFLGISFQPSALAHIVLMVYTATFLSENYKRNISFSYSFWCLWFPIFTIVGLVFIANLSTALMMATMVGMLVIIGGHPWKYIIRIIGLAVISVGIFLLIVKAYPDAMPHRVNTWQSRIENFFSEDIAKKDTYQIDHAKMAIATGGFTGLGVGKSVMRNFLPSSSSDFIYAIIIEEYGILGGIFLLGGFLGMLQRFTVISTNAPNMFGQLMVAGVGFSVIFQAFINIGVAVELLPVTGQTLPFITTGGTSIWMTFISIGIILSVSTQIQKLKEKTSIPEVSKEEISSEEEKLADETLQQIIKS